MGRGQLFRIAKRISPAKSALLTTDSMNIRSVSSVSLLTSILLAAPLSHVTATILPAPIVTNSAAPFSAAFAAANTVDGTEFEYASAGQGADTFIEYSFGAPQTFDKIIVLNRNSPAPDDWIGNFTLTLNGTTPVSVTRTALRGSSEIHPLGGLRTATTVRLDVDTLGGAGANNNTGSMEVLFVRTPLGQTPIAASIVGSAPAFNPFFAAENAVDGIVGRSSAPSGDGPEYASMGQGANTFVDFDLGVIAPVGGFDFIDRIADEDRITAFDLILSPNATFGDADDVVRSYTNSTVALGDVFTAIPARFIRFDVTANLGANTGISEIVFYQVPEPSSVALLSFGMIAFLQRRKR